MTIREYLLYSRLEREFLGAEIGVINQREHISEINKAQQANDASMGILSTFGT